MIEPLWVMLGEGMSGPLGTHTYPALHPWSKTSKMTVSYFWSAARSRRLSFLSCSIRERRKRWNKSIPQSKAFWQTNISNCDKREIPGNERGLELPTITPLTVADAVNGCLIIQYLYLHSVRNAVSRYQLLIPNSSKEALDQTKCSLFWWFLIIKTFQNSHATSLHIFLL